MLIALSGFFVSYFVFRLVDLAYALYYRKPLYVYVHLLPKHLPSAQKLLLLQYSGFYRSLTPKLQKYFEHRVVLFLQRTKFVPKDISEVTDEMKIRIASTAVMLTFGFRDSRLKLLKYVIVTPSTYFSPLTNAKHKGEFMPKRKSLVLSWSDFVEGNENKNDAINLGIHEFTHVLQLNSEKYSNLSAIIFIDSYKELLKRIAADVDLRDNIVASELFRAYAYTDPNEFLAVLLETFMERPEIFNEQFPYVYKLVRQMLNFRFPGY